MLFVFAHWHILSWTLSPESSMYFFPFWWKFPAVSKVYSPFTRKRKEKKKKNRTVFGEILICWRLRSNFRMLLTFHPARMVLHTLAHGHSGCHKISYAHGNLWNSSKRIRKCLQLQHTLQCFLVRYLEVRFFYAGTENCSLNICSNLTHGGVRCSKRVLHPLPESRLQTETGTNTLPKH